MPSSFNTEGNAQILARSSQLADESEAPSVREDRASHRLHHPTETIPVSLCRLSPLAHMVVLVTVYSIVNMITSSMDNGKMKAF